MTAPAQFETLSTDPKIIEFRCSFVGANGADPTSQLGRGLSLVDYVSTGLFDVFTTFAFTEIAGPITWTRAGTSPSLITQVELVSQTGASSKFRIRFVKQVITGVNNGDTPPLITITHTPTLVNPSPDDTIYLCVPLRV